MYIIHQVQIAHYIDREEYPLLFSVDGLPSADVSVDQDLQSNENVQVAALQVQTATASSVCSGQIYMQI